MFKVMTWNVENLFKPGAPAGPDTEALYEAKLEGLAATIDGQSPDALALQEIGDPEALADLVSLLSGSWHQRVSRHPDQRQIRVAWLTRRAISEPVDIVAFPEQLQPVQVDDGGTTIAEMGRGAVAITVTTDAGTPVRLVTAHLKSKLLSFPGGRFSPTTRTSGPGSPPTPSTAARPRRQRFASGRRRPSRPPRPDSR